MSSLGRASALIGAGTLISRVTGLLRTIVLVGVIGSVGAGAADAFAIANQLPNNVFSLISVGVLTAVIIPQIVKATADADGGNAFISKLFTLGTVVLVVITGLATIASPWLVWLYAGKDGSAEFLALATAFAYWCMPQILFYGLYALLGEALNARRIFGPFTWAPVVNNLVSIVGFLIIGALFGGPLTRVADWTPGMIAALGGTATLGILIQAGILLIFWRRTVSPCARTSAGAAWVWAMWGASPDGPSSWRSRACSPASSRRRSSPRRQRSAPRWRPSSTRG